MKKSCHTCFNYKTDQSSEPCVSCLYFDKWVAVDFLKSVMEEPVIKNGIKFDSDKAQWTLVPFKALEQVVDVLTIGAKKYAPDNWKKVPNARQRYIDAAFRHMSAYASGEKLDNETGKNHLAHAICCMLFLLAFDLDKTIEENQ